ncbi:MAG: RNA polymerase sigma factor [Verrucomicrobiales bacterium]|nr:sigma-70 family RNA polymerase sigma factor [Verrucomicrobiae bacterium]
MDGNMPSTRWTLVERLRRGDEPDRRTALDDLCRQYHYPLYCHIRRRGFDHHDAQDALHDFFAKLLRNESFATADSGKGRLRTYLLSALQRFLINWRRDHRHRDLEISAEAEAALAESEGRYQREHFADSDSPDRIYERQWVREVIGAALDRLRLRYSEKGKAALFDTLRPVLLSGGSLTGHDSEALAASLGMKIGALRMALSRLLEDFRETLRAEIVQTTSAPDEVKEEFRHLVGVFGE